MTVIFSKVDHMLTFIINHCYTIYTSMLSVSPVAIDNNNNNKQLKLGYDTVLSSEVEYALKCNV